MSVELLGVRVNSVGTIVLPVDDEAGRNAFWKAFWRTEIGQRFKSVATDKNVDLVGSYMERKYPGDIEITLPQLEALVELMLENHVFPEQQPEKVAPVVVDNRPRDPNTGRFLSEFETWAGDPHRSMSEIRTRAKQDPAFAKWYRDQLAGQITQDDSLKVLGAQKFATVNDQANVLNEFVEAFRRAPSSSLKPSGGYITLAGVKYTPQEFEQWISLASEAGLV